MKLHLPKKLFSAVMACMVALTTAWGATTVESKTLTSESATYSMENANVIIGDLTVESGVTGTVNFATTNRNTQIDHLNMVQEEGATTKLTVRAQTCDLLIIDDLTGAGQIEFNRASGNADWGYSVLLKDSDETTPNFTGTLSLQNSNVANNGNSMHLYLMSENAAKDATIELRQRTTLAVSTSTAKIAGLQGTHDNAAVISFANPNGTTGKDVHFDTNTGNCYNQNNSRDTNDGTERTLVLTGGGVYSYAGKIGSSGNNANKLNLTVAMAEGGKQTLSGTNYLKNLTVTSGELVISGDTVLAGVASGDFSIQNATLTINGSCHYPNGNASFGNVTVKEGGTLKLTQTDNTGWGNNGRASILLQGNGDNLAKLELGARQTTSINITLAGSALIESDQEGALDMYGGKISASGTNNTINAMVSTRANNVEFAVAEGGSLDVNGKMDSFGRTDGGAGTVTKSGAGTLTLNGAGSLFRNGIVVSGGELVFGEGSSTIAAGKTISIAEGATVTVAGTLSLGGGLSGAGTFTTADGAALHVGGATANADIHHAGGEIVFDGTLTMGEGKTLYLGSGFSVDIDDLSGFSSSAIEYVDASGNRSSEAHGFAEGTFSLVTGGTIDGSRTYTLAGQEWTLDNDHRTFSLSGAESRTSYLMMTGNEDSLSAIQTASEGHLATVVMNGGTLTVDSALAEGQGISIQGASTLSITEGTVLDKASVNVSGGTSTVTLDGAGEYVLGSPNLSETLAPGWTGIISVSGTKDGINLNSYANGNSKVKLNGLAGWIAMNSLSTSKELIMGEGADGAPAFKITAMSDNKTIKFTNKISGHGVFEVCDNNNATGDTVEFSGDVSGWDGTLKYNVNRSNAKTLKFSGSATTVNVGIENAAGTATVEFANANAVTVNSTFSGSGTTNLKLTGDGAKEFTKDVTVNNVDATGGAVTFDQAATANGTFSAGAVTAKGALTLNGTSTADTITVEGGSVAVNGSLTLNGENTIAYDKVTVGAGATLATGTNGSLGSDGIVYAKGATITGGDTAKNLSAWAGGYSVSGGEITINAGNGNNANRDISMVINGGAVTSNVTGTLTLKKDAVMDGFTGGKTNFNGDLTLNGDAAFNGDTTVSGTTTLSNATITIADGKSFTSSNETVTNVTEGTDATISTTGTDKTVSVGTADMTYTNALIDVTKAGEVQINATLADSKVKNSNEGASVKVSAGSLADGSASLEAAEGDITVSGDSTTSVSVKTVDVAAGKTLTIGDGTGTATVSGTATIADGGTVSGDLTIADGGSLNVTSATTTGIGAIVEGTLTFQGTGTATLTGFETLDLSSYTTATNLVLATAVDIKGWADKDVNDFFAGNVILADNMKGIVTVVPYGVSQYDLTAGDAGKQLVISLTQIQSGETPTTLTLGDGNIAAWVSDALQITVKEDLSNMAGDYAISVDDEQWKALVAAVQGAGLTVGDSVAVTLVGEAGGSIDLANPGEFTGTVAFNGYVGEGDGTYQMQFIPEPTTATLSLLALAGLAARRRRKASK